MIRLAAIHVLQNRVTTETQDMLNRAAKLTPNDPRIAIIRTMINHPNPEMKTEEKKN